MAGRATRVALAGTVVAVIAVVVLLFTPGQTYRLRADFLDAEGVVPGGRVEVAGRTVGSITRVGLSPSGQAELTLSITDGDLTPLHAGTRAVIRAVGLAGVTSNYIALNPGVSSAPTLSSGSVLPTTQTSGMVRLDALIDSFGPAQRRSLDKLLAGGAQIYAGSGSRYFNGVLARLSPALGALDRLSGAFSSDQGALREVIVGGSAAASAVASRSGELTNDVTYTARALNAVADRQEQIADAISRMPDVVTTARAALRDTTSALAQLRPALRAVMPAAEPLRDFLGQTEILLPQAGPVLGELSAEIPDVDRSLRGLVPLGQPASAAFRALGPAMKGLFPIAQGLRYYGTDLVLGSLAGLFGSVSGEYDGIGHYAKVNFTQPIQEAAQGPLASLLSAHPLLPGLFGIRSNLTRRCPGGNQPPAPDGSNPWELGPQLCTAADDLPLSVDFP